MFRRRAASTWEDIGDVRRWNGSSWTDAGFVRRWNGSSWTDVWPTLAIVLTNRNVTALGFQSVNDAVAGIRVSSDTGLYTRINSNYALVSGQWMDPLAGAAASNYECRLTNNSGTPPSGPSLGTWLSCGFTRDWHITKANATTGSVVSSNTLEIRDASTLSVLATATIDLDASVEA